MPIDTLHLSRRPGESSRNFLYQLKVVRLAEEAFYANQSGETDLVPRPDPDTHPRNPRDCSARSAHPTCSRFIIVVQGLSSRNCAIPSVIGPVRVEWYAPIAVVQLDGEGADARLVEGRDRQAHVRINLPSSLLPSTHSSIPPRLWVKPPVIEATDYFAVRGVMSGERREAPNRGF
jgi:hypothetical protein